MKFANIDWSIEKSKLKFDKARMPRQSQIRKRWPNPNGEGSRRQPSPLAQLTYDGEKIGAAYALEAEDGSTLDLHLAFFSDAQQISFLRKSLLRVSLLRLEEFISRKPAVIRLAKVDDQIEQDAIALGFSKTNDQLTIAISPDSAAIRVGLKRRLRDYVKSAPKIGRGFLIDAGNLDHLAVKALNHEYGDVAWGSTNWARHSTISADELALIEHLPKGGHALEVGAGSGRVTAALVESFDSIVATDVVAETLTHLSALSQKVEPKLDDIVASNLADSTFDVVMFWENGLGAILTLEDRQRAVGNMARVLKPGGTLLLAVRELLSVSVDQLMIAAQSDSVMGIYHTFSEEEMRAYELQGVRLMKIINGGERPAGGREKFYFFEKANR